ncbi:MAG: PTS sugar transporter subunit IIC, partial [Clostridiales bacterium]|nr:PTS sugar transporter subunit IIC [Clostridiales bacterium]
MAEKTKFDFAQFIKKAAKRYFLDAMSAMALGLFASLIIGLIISQLSKFAFLSWLAPFGSMLAASSPVVGSAIGVACAFGLKVKPLAMLASAATGAIGYDLGGPVGAYVASVVGAELGNLIAGKTPVDIVLVPIVTIITGGLAGTFVGPGVSAMMSGLGAFINTATEMNPVPMGIIVSTVVGMVLTLPISSAALCISLGLEGIAAGAAAVGCSAQMIGFAVMSYRENKFGGLLAQGLGTSML